jgi:cytochrome c-type biogenesis protein CcmH
MMTLFSGVWLSAGLMCLAALFMLVRSLARTRSGVSAFAADRAHFEAHLEEIERQRRAGLIGGVEAKAAVAEAGRRMLSRASATGEIAEDASPTFRRIGVAALFVMVPALAFGVYARTGAPAYPDMPLAERRAAEPQQFAVMDAVNVLESRLAARPDDVAILDLLAPAYLQLGRFDAAASAFDRVLAAGGESEERLAGAMEARIALNGGGVSGEAKLLLDRLLARAPGNEAGRYYRAMELHQTGRREEAVATLRALRADFGDPARQALIDRALARIGAAP